MDNLGRGDRTAAADVAAWGSGDGERMGVWDLALSATLLLWIGRWVLPYRTADSDAGGVRAGGVDGCPRLRRSLLLAACSRRAPAGNSCQRMSWC